MGVPAYQASGSAWPTHVTGDLALLVVNKVHYYTAPTALTVASGFKALARVNFSNLSTTIFWCIATSNAMASPTVNGNTDSLGTSGIIHTFRGCDTINPIIIGKLVGQSSFPSTALATAAGTSGATVPKFLTDSLFVAIMATPNSAITLSTYGGTSLSSITERFDGSMTYGSGHVVTAVPGADETNGPLSATLSSASYAGYIPLILQGPTAKTYSRSRVVNQ